MLSDRDYMREAEGRPPLSMTVKLMIAIVAVFAAVQIELTYFNGRFFGYLPLSFDGIKRGHIWQLLTFQFLHVGLLHLAGNLLGLWFCGRFVEHVLGRWRFLFFYLASGVCGGLLHLLFAASLSRFDYPVLGASAGVMATVALFCMMQPEAEFLMFFVIPVKARVLLIAETAITVFFVLVPNDPGVAHAAHLGGIIAAALFFRFRWHDAGMPLPWEGLGERLRLRFRRRAPATILTPRFKATPIPRAEMDTPLDDADYIAREVDPILDKIAAHGLQSLTDREKKILASARDRMAKR